MQVVAQRGHRSAFFFPNVCHLTRPQLCLVGDGLASTGGYPSIRLAQLQLDTNGISETGGVGRRGRDVEEKYVIGVLLGERIHSPRGKIERAGLIMVLRKPVIRLESLCSWLAGEG